MNVNAIRFIIHWWLITLHPTHKDHNNEILIHHFASAKTWISDIG